MANYNILAVPVFRIHGTSSYGADGDGDATFSADLPEDPVSIGLLHRWVRRNTCSVPMFMDHYSGAPSHDGDGNLILSADGDEEVPIMGFARMVFLKPTRKTYQLATQPLFREHMSGEYSFEGDGEMIVGWQDPFETMTYSLAYQVADIPDDPGPGPDPDPDPTGRGPDRRINSDMTRHW